MTNKEKATELGIKYARQYHHNTYPEYSTDSGFVYSKKEIEKACQEMAEWKGQKMIEKALQIYLKELVQFNNLLVRLNPEYDKLIDVDKSYDDFKRKMKSEL